MSFVWGFILGAGGGWLVLLLADWLTKPQDTEPKE